MNTLGKKLRLTSYGESHSEYGVGAVLDGFPAQFKPDLDFVRYQMERRRPGYSSLSSPRKEADEFVFTSGILKDRRQVHPFMCWYPIPIRNPKTTII